MAKSWDYLQERSTIPEPNSGCLLWFGTTNDFGYGRIVRGGRPLMAHRVAYEAKNGPIEQGKVIDHLCRVRCCVNPDHMEVVTAAENARRGTRFLPRVRPVVPEGKAVTHCPKGHEYTIGNTRIRKNGQAACRACEKAYAAKWYEANGDRWRAHVSDYKKSVKDTQPHPDTR